MDNGVVITLIIMMIAIAVGIFVILQFKGAAPTGGLFP
jgi:hypothetical protein